MSRWRLRVRAPSPSPSTGWRIPLGFLKFDEISAPIILRQTPLSDSLLNLRPLIVGGFFRNRDCGRINKAMKTAVTRPALLPLLACGFCGSALLTVGLYQSPPTRAPYSSSRRNISQSSTRDPQPSFEGKDLGKTGDVLQAIAVYFLAALVFAGGLFLWRRRAPKGYRLGDLWGKRWAGGKALWLILNLHFVGSGYSLLLLVGLVLALF